MYGLNLFFKPWLLGREAYKQEIKAKVSHDELIDLNNINIRHIRGHFALLGGPFLKQFYPDTSGSLIKSWRLYRLQDYMRF